MLCSIESIYVIKNYDQPVNYSWNAFATMKSIQQNLAYQAQEKIPEEQFYLPGI
jgi:hypothetical protein